MVLQVDVFSDVICPWCFIGKRRLEKAIGAQRDEIRVRWLPFQLNPQMPKEGISRRDYRIRKFGAFERSLELDAKVVAVGATEGIHFAFDQIERTPNTVDAHRLIWLADKEGVQNAVVEALFLAYFSAGRDIGNRQALIEVVAEAGLDGARLKRAEWRWGIGSGEGGRRPDSAASSGWRTVFPHQRQDHASGCTTAGGVPGGVQGGGGGEVRGQWPSLGRFGGGNSVLGAAWHTIDIPVASSLWHVAWLASHTKAT